MADSTLTPRQARFAAEYLLDLCAKQAAIRAGYSAKTAEVTGCRLLTHVKVAAAVAAGQAERARRTEITSDRVLTELAKLGFSNMADYMRVGPSGDPQLHFGDLTRDQQAALAEVTVDSYVEGSNGDAREVKRVKFKLADKRAALVDIGRHLGMFKERHEITGKDGAAIVSRIELVPVAPAPRSGEQPAPDGERSSHANSVGDDAASVPRLASARSR